jgi:hypothetical protein
MRRRFPEIFWKLIGPLDADERRFELERLISERGEWVSIPQMIFWRVSIR